MMDGLVVHTLPLDMGLWMIDGLVAWWVGLGPDEKERRGQMLAHPMKLPPCLPCCGSSSSLPRSRAGRGPKWPEATQIGNSTISSQPSTRINHAELLIQPAASSPPLPSRPAVLWLCCHWPGNCQAGRPEAECRRRPPPPAPPQPTGRSILRTGGRGRGRGRGDLARHLT